MFLGGYAMKPNVHIQYCAKVLGISLFASHVKANIYFKNRADFSENLTCGRDKCYLTRVTFKQLIMQTGSLAIIGKYWLQLVLKFKSEARNLTFLLKFSA